MRIIAIGTGQKTNRQTDTAAHFIMLPSLRGRRRNKNRFDVGGNPHSDLDPEILFFLRLFRWLLGLVVTRWSINVVALRRARLVLGWVTVREYTVLVFN